MPPGNMRRPGLELIGQGVVRRLLEGHRANHVTPALVGRHGLQEGGLAIQDANASRPVQLMAGEGVEVAVEILHIHLQMRHGLGPIDQHRHPLSGAPSR